MRMFQSIENTLRKPYLLFYSVLMFFTPLIFGGGTNEIYEFPKIFFLYYFGIFIIFFFISDVILKPVRIKRPHPLVVLFLLLTVISTLFSSHFYTSFFGYYSRFYDGLLSYLILFGLYFVGINKLEESDFEKILKIAIFTILPISFLGLSQYFSGVERVYSTIGQPNWLAQYLGMLLPLVLYMIFAEGSKKFKIWLAVYILGFYCLWVTYSTSGITSFFIGFLILILNIREDKKEIQNFGPKLISVFLVTFFIVFLNLGMFKDKLNDAFLDLKNQVSFMGKSYTEPSDNEVIVSAGADNVYKVSDPGFIRLNLWKSTLNLIFSDPKIFFIGSGPETFPYVFQKFRGSILNYSSEWDFVFNKPHNYYLEIWSESGIFSLLSFVTILYLVLKKSPAFLVPSFCVFMVSNFFGWPVVPTGLLFCFLICGISDFDSISFPSYGVKKERETAKCYRDSKTRRIVLIPLWFFYFFIVYRLSFFFSADKDYKKSLELIKRDSYDSALYYADRAVFINPLEPSYYRGRAKVRSAFLVHNDDVISVKKAIFDDLKKAEELNPENLVTVRNSIPIYYLLAIKDFYAEPGENNADEKYVEIVKDFFARVKHKYWNDAGVISSVAKYEKKLGLEKEFEESKLRISKLRPDLLEWHESFR